MQNKTICKYISGPFVDADCQEIVALSLRNKRNYANKYSGNIIDISRSATVAKTHEIQWNSYPTPQALHNTCLEKTSFKDTK